MWVLWKWLIKRKYRKDIDKLKKEGRASTDNEALHILLRGRYRVYRRRAIIITTTWWAMVLVIAIFTRTVFKAARSTQLIAATSGSIFEQQAVEEEEEEEEMDWGWGREGREKIEGITGPGGLYPKDPKLRVRAELLEIIVKSCQDVESTTGVRVEPAWVLGTIFRETGNSLFIKLNEGKVDSLYKDLVITNPACGKGSSCKYTSGGVSHYHLGTVSGGVDRGDPYSQVINTDKEPYNRFYPSGSGGHAVGYIQFESPYVYNVMNKIFGEPTPVLKNGSADSIQKQVKVDDNLGFIRPNVFYMPDAFYNGTFHLGSTPRNCNCKNKNPSSYESIINSADFRGLSDYNQDAIKFLYSTLGYMRGHIEGTDDAMVRELIRLAKSGALEDIDDLLEGKESKYWDDKSLMWKGSRGPFVKDVKAAYGINVSSDWISWQALHTMAMGRLAYNKLTAAIDAAEKEQVGGGVIGPGSGNGNWIDRPGSGRFGNSGSSYYLDDIGIRWYHQYSGKNQYSQNWGNLKLRGVTRTRTPYPLGGGRYEATMASGGCGIYTMAMIASNLLDKDITPDMALNALGGKHLQNCLLDSGVPVIAKKFGLKTKEVNYKSSDIMTKVKEELNKGNMILFVSRGGPYPWYAGQGHFMAIRGMTDDGKLLGITSTGSKGKTAQEVMKVPVTPQAWLKSLSPNRNYVWVVGLNVD